MATVRQTSFAAGELDPKLHGRTDLAFWAHGLKTCRNFFISREGAAVSRPGTRFVAGAKYVDSPSLGDRDIGQVRLIPFVAGDGASAVLEVGNQYIRFHTLGRTLEAVPGTPYEVTQYTDTNNALQTLPYDAASLKQLRFAQVGDVLTLAHPLYPPLELRRHSATNWECVEVSFEHEQLNRFTLSYVDADDTTVTSDFTVDYSTGGGVLNVADQDHPVREWQWMVTAICQVTATGEVFETLGNLVTQRYNGSDYDGTATETGFSDNWPIYQDLPITLRREESAGLLAPGPTTFAVKAYNIYRGRGGIFGWIGQTKSREFVDVGAEPDYALQPPIGTDPFAIESNGSHMRPRTVGFFQGRRVWGGAAVPASTAFQQTNTIFASRTNDYKDHDTRLAIHVAGEALVFELASMKREDIVHLVPRERLVVLTNATGWTFGGGGLEPLDFDSVDARVTDDVGASDVVPQVVDGCVLFIRNKGAGARALVPGSSDAPYQGIDISVRAAHLFVGANRKVVDWAYAEDPFGLVWAVRDDGALLSLTFDKQEQLFAWARHDTDGDFESVCSVPEGDEDGVYVAVVRTINGSPKRYIERLTSRVRRVLESDANPVYTASPGATDTDSLYPTDICSDCSFTYAGPVVGTISDPKLLNLLGASVYVTGRGMPALGPFVVTQNGLNGEVVIDADVTPAANAVTDAGAPIWVVHVGLAFTADLETLSVRGPATLAQKTVSEVGFELDQTKGVQTGQDFEHLTEWDQREVSDSYDAIGASTVLLNVPVENVWDKNARAVLRQALPLPVTVVGVSREVVANND